MASLHAVMQRTNTLLLIPGKASPPYLPHSCITQVGHVGSNSCDGCRQNNTNLNLTTSLASFMSSVKKTERELCSYSLVGNGNSLLQSRCSWASKDKVSKRLTKNSQLRAGMSFLRKCSRSSLLRMIGRSLTTVSNWKSRHKHKPCKKPNASARLVGSEFY